MIKSNIVIVPERSPNLPTSKMEELSRASKIQKYSGAKAMPAIPKGRITPVFKSALPPMKKTPMPVKKISVPKKPMPIRMQPQPIRTRPIEVPKKVAPFPKLKTTLPRRDFEPAVEGPDNANWRKRNPTKSYGSKNLA